MSDLWDAAGDDFDRIQVQAALALADAKLEGVMPFLLASRSAAEYSHREAIALSSISSIAEDCGINVTDLMATARRRYELYRQALAEGEDPLSDVVNSTRTYGTGPEEDYGHQEGPDFSHGYSEVPQGPLDGPNPQVTQVRPPMTGPVQEATGSLRRRADSTPGSTMTPGYTMPQAPDTGTTPAVDTSVPSASTAGMSPTLPAGLSSNGDDNVPLTPSSIGQVTSAADPVRRRVMAVTAAVAASNPHLPGAECERIARQVVGRFLRHADLDSSVMNDDPGSSSSGGSSGGGSGDGAVQHMLEGQGLRSMIPGMGGGGGAGAGAAAGGLEDAAMLAAL